MVPIVQAAREDHPNPSLDQVPLRSLPFSAVPCRAPVSHRPRRPPLAGPTAVLSAIVLVDQAYRSEASRALLRATPNRGIDPRVIRPDPPSQRTVDRPVAARRRRIRALAGRYDPLSPRLGLGV